MTYKLAFNESALKEWKKLGHTIQEQFKKKLRERLENPRVPASQLHGRKDQYKIKLRGAGYRLVYSVEDEIITVTCLVLQINIWFIIVLSLKQITSPSLI